jgi:hypothetical protein
MAAMTEPHRNPESHDESDPVPDAHGTSAVVAGSHGATDDHGGDHGHGHADMALGPTDWRMWTVGAVGTLVAIVMTVGFVVATGFDFSA